MLTVIDGLPNMFTYDILSLLLLSKWFFYLNDLEFFIHSKNIRLVSFLLVVPDRLIVFVSYLPTHDPLRTSMYLARRISHPKHFRSILTSQTKISKLSMTRGTRPLCRHLFFRFVEKEISHSLSSFMIPFFRPS